MKASYSSIPTPPWHPRPSAMEGFKKLIVETPSLSGTALFKRIGRLTKQAAAEAKRDVARAKAR